MRNFAIFLIFTALFAGVFGVAQSHDTDSFAASQTTPTPEPDGLFGDPPTNSATIFDLTTTPSEEVFYAYNGEVTNGALVFNAPVDDEAYADFFIPVQDYSIEMDVTFSSFDEETIFFYFLLRVQDDFCNVEFAYDPAFGEVYTTVRLAEGCEDWEDLDFAEGPVFNLNQTYNMRLVAEGNTYSMFIDGEEILSVQEDSFIDGYVGVIGILGPAEATITNLVVTDLAVASGAAAPRPTATPGQSGGLFGNSPDSTPDSSGGLFGDNPNPTPSGDLFGGS